MATSASGGDVAGARRGSKWLALCELGAVLGLYVADVYRLIPLSKTPFLFVVGWVSLRARGADWRDVGFAKPGSWNSALALGALAGAGMSLLELFGTHPLLSRLVGRPTDLSDFQPMVGNLGAFLVTLVLVWILAVFGEELVYRGYLMNRVAEFGKGTPARWTLSLLVVSVVFGAGHIDQGLTGMLENVINGVWLGLLYLGARRNLAAPIAAHGVTNTVDLLLIFLGKYPGP